MYYQYVYFKDFSRLRKFKKYIYIYIYILVCSILNSVRTSHMYLIVSIFKFIRVYANMREVTTNE